MPFTPLEFDVDRYIDPFIPRSRLYLLPKPIAWFFGHRSQRIPPLGNVLIAWWAFLGAFCSLIVIEAVFQTRTFKLEKTPLVIASLGAAAILEFNTVDSPLSQPRNCLLGQIFAAVIGVGITKLFQLNPDFENLRWIAGALAVGITSAAMGLTKTIHPPAGATALLAATSQEITALGWFLIPLVILGSSLMLAVACIINNIQRQFPVYWWTPADLGQSKQEDSENQQGKLKEDVINGNSSWEERMEKGNAIITVDDKQIIIPDWVSLDAEEMSMLEILRSKLQEGLRRQDTEGTHGT